MELELVDRGGVVADGHDPAVADHAPHRPRDPWPVALLFLGTPPIGTLVFIAILAFGRRPAERDAGTQAGAPAPDGSDAAGGR
jgi:hypothetical protein